MTRALAPEKSNYAAFSAKVVDKTFKMSRIVFASVLNGISKNNLPSYKTYSSIEIYRERKENLRTFETFSERIQFIKNWVLELELPILNLGSVKAESTTAQCFPQGTKLATSQRLVFHHPFPQQDIHFQWAKRNYIFFQLLACSSLLPKQVTSGPWSDTW